MKKLLFLFFGFTLFLTACGGDDYASAAASPPSTWAGYTCGDLSFRFIAGWHTASWDSFRAKADEASIPLNIDNRLTLLGHFASPVQDQGTTDYLTIGYYSMRSEITAQDLEGIMDELNNLADVLSFDTIDTVMLQNARIRTYSENTALTFATRSTRDCVTYVAQTALIPRGQRLYAVVYSDFSTKEDNTVLEQFITSLQLP